MIRCWPPGDAMNGTHSAIKHHHTLSAMQISDLRLVRMNLLHTLMAGYLWSICNGSHQKYAMQYPPPCAELRYCHLFLWHYCWYCCCCHCWALGLIPGWNNKCMSHALSPLAQHPCHLPLYTSLAICCLAPPPWTHSPLILSSTLESNLPSLPSPV